MKTPIQELFEFLGEEYDIFQKPDYWLKLEKEFAHKCFIAGADYGLDLGSSIDWGESPTEDNFEQFYKKYKE